MNWSALRPSKCCGASLSPAANQRGDQVPELVSQTLHGGRSQGGAGQDELGALAAALGGPRRQRLET